MQLGVPLGGGPRCASFTIWVDAATGVLTLVGTTKKTRMSAKLVASLPIRITHTSDRVSPGA
jgi:hypothetical protein